MARNAGEPLFRRSHGTRTRVSLRFGLPSRDTGVPTCGNGEKFVDLHYRSAGSVAGARLAAINVTATIVHIVRIRVLTQQTQSKN